MTLVAVWALGCMLAGPSQAEVFRCVQADGSTKYSDEPCSKGERGGQINVQPQTIDASGGRERTQKFLSDLKNQAPRQMETAPAVPQGGGAASATRTDARMQRWERCEPLLEQASGVRRQAIGALCGADMDEALFNACLDKVNAAQGVGETDAVVRACTGSGLQNGAVIVQPARPRFVPAPWPATEPKPHPQPRNTDKFDAPSGSMKEKSVPSKSGKTLGWQPEEADRR